MSRWENTRLDFPHICKLKDKQIKQKPSWVFSTCLIKEHTSFPFLLWIIFKAVGDLTMKRHYIQVVWGYFGEQQSFSLLRKCISVMPFPHLTKLDIFPHPIFSQALLITHSRKGRQCSQTEKALNWDLSEPGFHSQHSQGLLGDLRCVTLIS